MMKLFRVLAARLLMWRLRGHIMTDEDVSIEYTVMTSYPPMACWTINYRRDWRQGNAYIADNIFAAYQHVRDTLVLLRMSTRDQINNCPF